MSERKLTINHETWHYSVGKQFAVIRYPDSKKKITVSLSKITGLDPDVIQKGKKNGNQDGMVKPSDMKSYILTYCRIQK